MMNDIKLLIGVLVNYQDILENKATKLRELGVFKSVVRTTSFMDYPNNKCPSISSSLNADLFKPIDNDLHCISFSFTFFINKKENWEVHTELGWSSYDEGFVDYKMEEKEYEELPQLLKSIDLLLIEFMKDYDTLVSKVI